MLLNSLKKHKLLGIKLPKHKRLTKGVNNMKMDVLDIHLNGKEHENVPIYNMCNEV
jgi:hypothetical protein